MEKHEPAVEKPKRDRFLAVINSPFFLWVMSVLLLSIGGSYITNHKQCLDDAEKTIARRNHLSQELLVRGGALAARVAKAKTLKEANKELTTALQPPSPVADQDNPGSIFTDLSSRNYVEIQAEFETLSSRIKYAEIPDISITERRLKSPVTFGDTEKLAEELQRSPPSEDQTLKLTKMSFAFSVAMQTFEQLLDGVAYDFRPNCSVINVAELTFGYQPPIVLAEVNPLYTAPIRRKAIEAAIQPLEQQKRDLDSEIKKTFTKP